VKHFILPNIEALCNFNRIQGIANLFHAIVKEGLRSDEAEKVKEYIIFNHLMPDLIEKRSEIHVNAFLNFAWCLACEDKFEERFWPKPAMHVLIKVLRPKHVMKMNRLDTMILY
jgi:hypothetical protein